MDHPLFDLIEQKIRAAEEAGDFDNLEGAGKPLPKVDDPENAVFNRLVQESGAVPEFVRLSRELRRCAKSSPKRVIVPAVRTL